MMNCMKRILSIIAFFAFFALHSCEENNTTFPNEADGVYRGKLTVGDYTRDAGISITENGDSTVDIFFDNVKFAALMPVKIDITLKDIPCSSGEVLSFSAENVDPYINKETVPQPGYRFSRVEGTVTGNELLLSAKMASGLAAYVAGKDFFFRGSCGTTDN